MFTRKMEYKCIIISQDVDLFIFNDNEPVFRVRPTAVDVAPWYIGQPGRNEGLYIHNAVGELKRVIDLWDSQKAEEAIPPNIREIMVLNHGEYKIERKYHPLVYDLIDDDEIPF